MSSAPTLLRRDATAAHHRSVLVHSFISGAGTNATSPLAPACLNEVAASVLQTCMWVDHPVTVAELAARQQISPAVIAVAVSDLLDRGLLHLHHPTSPAADATHLRRVIDHMNGHTPPSHLVKILVVGGHRSGVSTFVGQVADSAPLVYADPPNAHGRIRIDTAVTRVEPGLYLGLFGASGLTEDSPQWTDLTRHAVGAVALAHSDRIAEAAPAVRALDAVGVPFAVGVNLAPDADPCPAHVRSVLGLADDAPVVMGDARLRDAVTRILMDLCIHVETSAACTHDAPVGGR
ncbi:DUF742 domain-containing protein [Nocardiopsis sp. CNT312]|uniref:DUF742 domain-containing protein n=1 Tax=Nocardiopsis sp. CNT312 TaxID=1137268 RepID=UPI0004915AB5|nr:DUF742 domain-containing protein [Nocardiopsis sp. CNT312]